MESKFLDYLNHLASFQFLVSYTIRNIAKKGSTQLNVINNVEFIRGHDAVDHMLNSFEIVTT
jgi:hypothetical protein